MRKIYNYILPALLALLIVSCDDTDAEVVQLTNQDPVATVTSVSPMKGYIGSEFTVVGTNFGIVMNDIKVLVGEKEMKILSCEDEQIKVEVPEGTTAGNVSLIVYGQKIDTKQMFDVLGEPGVTSVEPPYGFVGDEITFKGHDLEVSSTLYKVQFNGKEDLAVFASEPTNESFTVKVPQGVTSGKITLEIDGKVINVSPQFTVLQRADLAKLSPEEGFGGSEITIIGTNLNPDLLEVVDDLKPVEVFFRKGKDKFGPAEIVGEVTNTEIKVKAPAELTEGEYVVSVNTSFESITKTLAYKVLPSPVVESLSVKNGYVGTEIVITGKNFGTKSENIKVLFGEAVGDKVAVNEEGTEIKVAVPVPFDGVFGKVNMVVKILGLDIYEDEFTINSTPTISSIETITALAALDEPHDKLIKVGEIVTLKGTGLNSSSLIITFGDVEATPESITESEIKVAVPDGFNSGMITVQYPNIPVIEVGPVTLMTSGMDITKYVLKNSVPPLKGAGFVGNEWDARGLDDWNRNSVLTERGIGCLQYPTFEGSKERDPNGAISLHVWSRRDNKNGKLWQAITLPKGKYEFKLGNIAVGRSNGYINVAFVICSGTEEEDIPNYDNGSWTLKQKGVKGELPMTVDYKEPDAVTIDLTDDSNKLLVAFVTWANYQVWASFSSVTVKFVEQ